MERLVDALEGAQSLDPVVDRLRTVADLVGAGGQGAVLRGDWLGHALHPLVTDFPLGCWLAAGLLDVTGPRSGRAAAQRLVGAGLLTVPLAAATGLADWATIRNGPVRRVGVAHALGNTVVASAYFMSWRARRRGAHGQGVAWGLAGGGLAWVTGYLGGHLSFGRGVGVGERGGLTGVAAAGQDTTASSVPDAPEVHQAS